MFWNWNKFRSRHIESCFGPEGRAALVPQPNRFGTVAEPTDFGGLGGGALNGTEAVVRSALVQVSSCIIDVAKQRTNAPNIRKCTKIIMKIMEIGGLGEGP